MVHAIVSPDSRARLAILRLVQMIAITMATALTETVDAWLVTVESTAQQELVLMTVMDTVHVIILSAIVMKVSPDLIAR